MDTFCYVFVWVVAIIVSQGSVVTDAADDDLQWLETILSAPRLRYNHVDSRNKRELSVLDLLDQDEINMLLDRFSSSRLNRPKRSGWFTDDPLARATDTTTAVTTLPSTGPPQTSSTTTTTTALPTTNDRDPTSYPGFKQDAFPEVFTVPPPQPAVKKPGHLPQEKIQEYFENGFLVVENLFTPEELEPVRDSFRRLVDQLAQKLYKTGRVKNLYEDHGLGDRLLMLDKEWPGALILIVKVGRLTPEFRALYQHEKLLDIVEQLVGPNVGANPIWNTRPKAPGHAETHPPWHQDSAYFDDDSYSTLIVTAWVAFVDITKENGCLEFCRGGQKKGQVVVHEGCDNFYLRIKEEEMVWFVWGLTPFSTLFQSYRGGADPKTDFIKCPVKAGGVVFFNNMVPHRSIPNLTKEIRWAMDLRFQDANKPWGYHGMKNGILLRSPDKPDHVPDWDLYDGQDRFEEYAKEVLAKTGQESDEFDTFITGPHMDRWKVVQHNKHTERHFAQKTGMDTPDKATQQ